MQSPSLRPQAVVDPLDAEMGMVDEVIRRRLRSEVALVDQISQYIIGAGGKRVRPRLVLLTSRALGYQGPARFDLAAIVEFIHTATLLHDDVVDESPMRRGRQTANALFGNAASVLVGDFLYSRAFQMMVDIGRMRVLDVLAEATNVIAEGEVLQLMHTRDTELTVDAYMRVIRYKTAKLFEASARLGAVIAGADPLTEENCAAYGQSVGTAFQLIDDLLDYQGDARQTGKEIGTDLREGKITLPLLVALQRGNDRERSVIRAAIESGIGDRFEEVQEIVARSGALEATHRAASDEANRAAARIAALPESDAKQGLLEFCVRSVDRSS